MKVLITRKIPDVAEQLLLKNNFDVTVFSKDRAITKDELLKNAKNADGIISLLTEKFDKDVIDKLPKCKVIANYAVGYNNIDVEYARSKNIFVTNTPDVLTDSTADLTMSLILACARRITESEQFLRDRKFVGWKPQLLLGTELKGKTLGIIGAGRIGQETVKRAKGFGVKIIYYDRNIRSEFEREFDAKKVSLNKLLKTSDIISVHLPLTLETYHLLNKNRLKLLKQTSIIVNTSRGEIINERELIKLLETGKIFSAGLDVFENEPNIKKEFFGLKNVVLLPHIGSATLEARNGMAELAAKNVIRVLGSKKPLTPVLY